MPQQVGEVSYDVRIAGSTAILTADGRTVATLDLSQERAARLSASGWEGEHLRDDLCQMWVTFWDSMDHVIDTDDPNEVCRVNDAYRVVRQVLNDPSIIGVRVARAWELRMGPRIAIVRSPRGSGRPSI